MAYVHPAGTLHVFLQLYVWLPYLFISFVIDFLGFSFECSRLYWPFIVCPQQLTAFPFLTDPHHFFCACVPAKATYATSFSELVLCSRCFTCCMWCPFRLQDAFSGRSSHVYCATCEVDTHWRTVCQPRCHGQLQSPKWPILHPAASPPSMLLLLLNRLRLWRQRLPFGDEAQRRCVHAVALPGGPRAIGEHMACRRIAGRGLPKRNTRQGEALTEAQPPAL